MQIKFNKGHVVLVGENDVESARLFAFAQESSQGATKRIHKPHRKHQFTKKCDVCGKACKGEKGLGIHKVFSHGIASPRRTQAPISLSRVEDRVGV